MKLRRYRLALALGLAPTLALGLFMGCKAGVHGTGGNGSGASTPTGTGNGTGTGASSATGTGTGGGATTATTGQFMAGSTSATMMDVPMNPCGTQCGPVEKCDGVNKGIDDNCDGQVDEGCPCEPGQAESCFKGDPSYINTPGCFPGTQICTELGKWGPCIGGAHATDNPPCFQASTGCHPISAVPFQTVDLSTGLGTFGQGGSNYSYMVDCPMGVTPCPAPDASGHLQVLVSGEYTVTFTETVNGQPKQCQYPLYVGAKGLRVELSWDFPTGGVSSDYDLHMHKPASTTPWNISGQSADDCGYGNCKISSGFGTMPFTGATAPNWFPTTQAMPGPGFPISWYKDPVMSNNTCYYAPRGEGQQWVTNGQGCHNPRLDLDNISCDTTITNPTDPSFCAPENINVDFPPTNTWIRIGVHLYPGTTTYMGVDHPDVKIYCDGKLAGELGKHGFYNPETPIAFNGGGSTPAIATFWPVADVKWVKDQCSNTCTVKAIYSNASAKLPLFEPNQQPGSAPPFGPPYPP